MFVGTVITLGRPTPAPRHQQWGVIGQGQEGAAAAAITCVGGRLLTHQHLERGARWQRKTSGHPGP